jgi:hypothetical protein
MPDMGDFGATATASAGEIGNTSGPAGGGASSTSAGNGGGNGTPDFGALALAGGGVVLGMMTALEASPVAIGTVGALLSIAAVSGQLSDAVAMGLSPNPAIAAQQLAAYSSFSTHSTTGSFVEAFGPGESWQVAGGGEGGPR